MSEKQYNVLILCTGNSARSILGEVLFNTLGRGKFKAYSAGSRPAGKVNPGALEWLNANGHSTEGLRSKSWDEFAAPGAPEFDFIFTVCDNAAGEACPLWLGKPATAHWGIPDPAHIEGDQARRAAFNKAAEQLARRIQLFMALPFEKLDKMVLKEKLSEIGRIQD
ncbi:MAG TPA: arsenate reductase ArsC [Gallionella sp.]|jgi:arsenate reductase|uniref:Protein-tyrosine phosphatase, low molecular weight n=1 Tax=Gallionella capsiferriformans (strain ES-2) TaxID=395494 RepID=D9SJY7_GALCS|nr:arsenate reductase ArsC [Gallionella capsiferriformans]ADL56399.1 Protein-tyrosine phosphatase, low molecular weight [Gallionella capsiferriformans ES-2]OGS66970.1 MAG: protein-tyrosine-phosphatase [Gallionellales bacterium GWA2_54_124]OGT19486.1 MAG: protein-tyrosine-phosphatase [Gallionellales bacterium RIFOXYD12_FULL_53_10]HCI51734.1 arsenate reductase ArsC [Gallionella sp.]